MSADAISFLFVITDYVFCYFWFKKKIFQLASIFNEIICPEEEWDHEKNQLTIL